MVVAAVLALTACSGATGSPIGGATSQEGNETQSSSAGNLDSGDCLLGANGADVEVGIADPTVSCAK